MVESGFPPHLQALIIVRTLLDGLHRNTHRLMFAFRF